MSRNASSPSRRSIVLTSRVLAGFGLGVVLAVAVASVIAGGKHGSSLNLEAGLLAIALLGLGYWVFVRRRASREAPADVPAIRLLQRHPELLVAYNSVTHGLVEISKHSDEIFRDTAAVRLATIQEEMQTLAAGQIIFAGTEAWRTAYEQVLRAPGLHRNDRPTPTFRMECDFRRELIARLASDQCPWSGTRRSTWPARAWLESRATICRIAIVIQLVWRLATKCHVRPMLIVPVGDCGQLTSHRTPA